MGVKEFRPDLVILDVMLPDINGKEVCQRVRSDPSMDMVKSCASPAWLNTAKSML